MMDFDLPTYAEHLDMIARLTAALNRAEDDIQARDRELAAERTAKEEARRLAEEHWNCTYSEGFDPDPLPWTVPG